MFDNESVDSDGSDGDGSDGDVSRVAASVLVGFVTSRYTYSDGEETFVTVEPKIGGSTVDVRVPHGVTNDVGVPREGEAVYFAYTAAGNAVLLGAVSDGHNGFTDARSVTHHVSDAELRFTEDSDVVLHDGDGTGVSTSNSDTDVVDVSSTMRGDAGDGDSSVSLRHGDSSSTVTYHDDGTVTVRDDVGVGASTGVDGDGNSVVEVSSVFDVTDPLSTRVAVTHRESASEFVFRDDGDVGVTAENGSVYVGDGSGGAVTVRHAASNANASFAVDGSCTVESDDGTTVTVDAESVTVGDGSSGGVSVDHAASNASVVFNTNGGVTVESSDGTTVTVDAGSVSVDGGSTPVVTDVSTTTDGDGHVTDVSVTTNDSVLL